MASSNTTVNVGPDQGELQLMYGPLTSSSQTSGNAPTGDPDSVDCPSLAYTCMSVDWHLLHSLLGGTRTMRAAGITFLPQEPKEENDAYNNRLRRSFLFNAFKDTVGKVSSKPFCRPVVVTNEDKLPEALQSISKNVDRGGTDITQLAAELLEAGVTYGITHILVDYPNVDPDINLATEKDKGIRPVFIHVTVPEIIGWKFDTDEAGTKVLSEIRIKYHEIVPAGAYGEKRVCRIRVYTKTTWEIWTEPEGDSKVWTKLKEGTHTFGGVPLITLYINKTGFMTGEAPLLDLAYLNLAHWQSSSDQRNILRYARCGLLFAKGIDSGNIVVGPNNIVRTDNTEADIKYVEVTGKSIEIGAADLTSLETQMEVLGLEPFIDRAVGRQTATAVAIDESKSQSSIQSWIRRLETAIEDAYKAAAMWIGVDISDIEFYIDIFNDFGITVRSATDIAALIALRNPAAPQIDQETFLRELKRRGLLSDTVDIDAVIQKVKDEGPSIGSLGMGDQSFTDPLDPLKDPTIPVKEPTLPPTGKPPANHPPNRLGLGSV